MTVTDPAKLRLSLGGSPPAVAVSRGDVTGDAWYRIRRTLRRQWMPLAAAVLVMASLAAGLLIANRKRVIAVRRFGEVRQLAGKLFDIDVQVAQLPGGSKTRQLIALAGALVLLKKWQCQRKDQLEQAHSAASYCTVNSWRRESRSWELITQYRTALRGTSVGILHRKSSRNWLDTRSGRVMC